MSDLRRLGVRDLHGLSGLEEHAVQELFRKRPRSVVYAVCGNRIVGLYEMQGIGRGEGVRVRGLQGGRRLSLYDL